MVFRPGTPNGNIQTKLFGLVLERGCKDLCLKNCELNITVTGPFPKVLQGLDLLGCDARYRFFELPGNKG